MVDPQPRYTRSRTTRRPQSYPRSGQPLPGSTRSMHPPLNLPGSRAAQRERGSATIWAVCVLLLVSAAVGCALIWIAAENTRHSTERAADSAALAAAASALRHLAIQDNSDPCVAAATAAGRAGAQLVRCECAPLDCTVTVRRSVQLFGPLAARLPGLAPVEATSRAGPVGESTGDGST